MKYRGADVSGRRDALPVQTPGDSLLPAPVSLRSNGETSIKAAARRNGPAKITGPFASRAAEHARNTSRTLARVVSRSAEPDSTEQRNLSQCRGRLRNGERERERPIGLNRSI